ncbi:hypothetical protein PDE_08145 [Penicillium oxalicum 114-2]|uniref:Uncharacterized protein n=1 Tax=Penicillium oxalicum (strain 114-2 / CGMCC 5302) TaxID=933388 RepID=S8B2X0_PENO1|nr:hypothetical protein PDE_08145 [Penicillium oxalicum 114-2]
MVHDPFANWYSAELLDSLFCSKCREFHGVHALCTPLEATPADAVSFPPRSIKSGISGVLSLHDYRKSLSRSAECVNDSVDHPSDKTLKRKVAKSNLHFHPSYHRRSLSLGAVSTSSRASSPPPLSPSYSHSILSYQSEFDCELSEASAIFIPPSQSARVNFVEARLTRPRPNRKRLNTFREKLQRNGQIPIRSELQTQRQTRSQTPTQGHSFLQPWESCTDTESKSPMLASSQAVATVSHGGALFEILNPRKSLDVTRIVSFIEDVDGCSVLSFDSHTESTPFSEPYTTAAKGYDNVSLSQFTDASFPSQYSSPSLYTTSPSMGCTTPKQSMMDVPSSSPGVHDHLHSLSEYSIHKSNHWSSFEHPHEFESAPASPKRALEFGLIDTSLTQIQQFSTPGREEAPDLQLSDPSFSASPASPSGFHCGESDIGEPGSPVYANGEWSQVDERDRGVLMDLPPPPAFNGGAGRAGRAGGYSEPPSPYDIYYANTMSPSFLPSTPTSGPHYDPYDPIFFDPHVQSVLAAANAENMGLRGNSARALDDLQRRFGSSVSLGGPESASGDGYSHKEHRKGSFSQRKKLKKLFSWRSGN